LSEKKKILFLGGSITAGGNASDPQHRWAYLAYRQFAPALWGGNTEYLNASISGTGSFLGAMRLSNHVLPYKPDMVFVEFAVNDGGQARTTPDAVIAALDHIVRALQQVNPQVVVVFVYTTSSGHNCASVHHVVAQHYGIPEIDLQTPMAAALERENRGWDYYLPDGVHPNDLGHQFYADVVTDTILANPQRFRTPTPCAETLAKTPFRNARIIPVSEADELSGFTYGPVQDDTHIKHLPELTVTHAAYSETPGSRIKMHFTGTNFAVYSRYTRGGGAFAVYIDGELAGTQSCFHNYRETYRYDGEFLGPFRLFGLPEGEHQVEIVVLDEKHENSSGYRVWIAGIFVG